MLEGTVRSSSSKTFSIKFKVNTTREDNITFDDISAVMDAGAQAGVLQKQEQAKGLHTLIKTWIGLITLIAIFSGAIIAKRFGMRSANKINREVTKVKERAKPIVCVQGPS
jgi:hypothetical protein